MGGGIAQVVAASGRRVSLYDSVPGAVERGLGAMEKSLGKLAEKGGADPGRRARARRAGRGDRPRGAADRGRRRGPGREGGDLPRGGRDPAARRDPRVQHLLHSDRHPGGRNRAAATGDRHALLQPRARDEPRRGRARAADLRRDGRCDRRARPRARQDAGRGERLSRLRLEPHPDAVHQRGCARPRGRRRRTRRRSTRSRSSASTTRLALWPSRI